MRNANRLTPAEKARAAEIDALLKKIENAIRVNAIDVALAQVHVVSNDLLGFHHLLIRADLPLEMRTFDTLEEGRAMLPTAV